jgi:hypothetical protein
MQEDVQMYRKKLVKDLYDNLHNKPHDMEFMSPPSTWTDDNGFVRLQDTPRQHDDDIKERNNRKRSRSDGDGSCVPEEKRPKPTTVNTTPLPRKTKSHKATTVQWKSQMEKPLESATHAYDLVCSEDSKFKQ